jgi:hypothetical protein
MKLLSPVHPSSQTRWYRKWVISTSFPHSQMPTHQPSIWGSSINMVDLDLPGWLCLVPGCQGSHAWARPGLHWYLRPLSSSRECGSLALCSGCCLLPEVRDGEVAEIGWWGPAPACWGGNESPFVLFILTLIKPLHHVCLQRLLGNLFPSQTHLFKTRFSDQVDLTASEWIDHNLFNQILFNDHEHYFQSFFFNNYKSVY